MSVIDQLTSRQGASQSAINSTTTALTAGNSFIGVKERNGFSHVHISIKTDQNCTLYLESSDDGSGSEDR